MTTDQAPSESPAGAPASRQQPQPLRERLPEREADIVVAWLREKAEQYGDVSLRYLAMYAEDGQA